MNRPLVGIVSSYNEIVPGHMNLDKIVEAVKLGVSMACLLYTSKSLSDLYTRYIENGGYVIYRSKTRDSVKYTHDCTVPIDGDYCSSSCRNRVCLLYTSRCV